MQENYLAKWLNNELSQEEIAVFKNSEEYNTYKKIIETTDTWEGASFDQQKAWRALDIRKPENRNRVISITPYKKLFRIAAIVTLIVGLSYFYFSSFQQQTITTQYAERTTITLPDASQVQLNAGSEITYNNKNWDKERNIVLKGEAFFDVAKGQRFTVSTDGGTVTVLGTQFNVENRKDLFEVSCYEGLVSVLVDENEIKLAKGEALIVVNGQLNTSKTQLEEVPSWLMHESNFKSIPLKFVLDEFERQFNLKVATKSLDLTQLFTGSFSNTDKNLALQSITAPSGIKFKLEGNEVLFYSEEP